MALKRCTWIGGVLALVREASAAGHASFPLSAAHYMEIYHQHDPDRRQRLVRSWPVPAGSTLVAIRTAPSRLIRWGGVLKVVEDWIYTHESVGSIDAPDVWIRGHDVRGDRALAGWLLPVYAGWAWIVVLVFPPLFDYL